MKKHFFAVFAAITTAGLLTGVSDTTAQARPNPACKSQREYKEVILRYLNAMENHSIPAIKKLFTANGTVVSTSVGNAEAVPFYKKFFPEIKTAKTKLLEVYKSTTNPNHYSASFIFTFTTVDGVSEGGAYTDEFYFGPNTCKLNKVVMYENMKTNQEM